MNCFHFSVSLGYKTTGVIDLNGNCLLWIAFIFQYLWDTKQQFIIQYYFSCSCELLSFFSIFGIQNNSKNTFDAYSGVVNCFHFSVSLGYKTTLYKAYLMKRLLWIAFIFQYLWDTKQLSEYFQFYTCSCELLSFFSIFGIQNNALH